MDQTKTKDHVFKIGQLINISGRLYEIKGVIDGRMVLTHVILEKIAGGRCG